MGFNSAFKGLMLHTETMTVYCDNLMKQINIPVLFTKEHMHTPYTHTHTHTHTHKSTRLNKYMFWTKLRVFNVGTE